MTRKTGQQKLEPQAEERENLSTIEEFDGDDLQMSPSVSSRIYQFLDRIELDEFSPVFYLSKYENYTSGEAKAFLKKFEDCDPPDEDLIGRLYGSGRYMLTCVIPPVRGKHKGYNRMYRFRVHPDYDHLGATPATVPSGPVHSISPETGMINAFSMIEKVLMMLVPLFNRPRDENVLGILNQNYTAVNELMKKQMGDNLKMLMDYQRTIADLGEAAPAGDDLEDEPAAAPSMLEQFGPLIQQWIPLLLGGGPQAKAAGAVVKAVPQVQQILRDKIELRKIIAYLDQTNGPDNTDKILEALKIKRAGKRPVAVQQPAAPPARQRGGKK